MRRPSAVIIDGRCGRPTVQARLPAEDRLLPEPTGDAPDCRCQVRRTPRVGLRERLRNEHASPTGEPLQVAHGKVRGRDALYGGVSREWLFLLSHEMFNSSYGLSEHSARLLHTTYQPCLGREPGHLDCLKFVDRVLGLAVFHHRFLGAYFVSSFYKMVPDKKSKLKDLEAVDYEHYLPGCCACPSSRSWSCCWLMPLCCRENDLMGMLCDLCDRRPLRRARRCRAQAGRRCT